MDFCSFSLNHKAYVFERTSFSPMKWVAKILNPLLRPLCQIFKPIVTPPNTKLSHSWLGPEKKPSALLDLSSDQILNKLISYLWILFLPFSLSPFSLCANSVCVGRAGEGERGENQSLIHPTRVLNVSLCAWWQMVMLWAITQLYEGREQF